MVVALLHSPKYKDSALSLAEVLRDMVDAKSLFRAALWRRSCLIAACLYLCDTALVATLFGGLPLLLRLQFIDLFKMLLRTALWMIPAHVALMFVVAAFFLETVCIDNPVYATQKLLYTILSPVTVGFILGHSLHQVASDMSSPYPVRGALPLSLLSGALAVAAFTSRRRAELRHQYVVEAAPAVFRKLWMRFCRLVPVALFDTLATVAYVFAAGLVSGALAALVETVLKTIKSAAVVVDSINADNIAAVRQVVPPFKLFMGLLLGLISCGLDLIRYGLVLIRFVCNVGSIRDTYHCILIFLVIYIALSLAEEIWRAILFHPMKFSRLRSFVASSGAPAECAVLAEAVTAILPPKISSAQGLMSKSADLPPIDHNNEQSRCKVKINSEAVSQNSQRQQLWLQTLIAQLDIADAILTAVKPSPSGHCPLVPALTCPSSACKGVSPDGSLSSALNDAVLVLMEALAAQDLSRSARGLHSLEVIGSTCQLYSATISQRQDELLESELDALPLAGKDWSKVAFSSCAIIDAAALQFTLAAAFIEDELSRNNMILFERCRMSERELITALFDLCSSYIPLSAMLKKMIASAYDLLFKPKISATFYKGENNSSSSSNDGVHLKPTIVSLPVIVSVDAITRSEGDLADGRLDNRLKVSSVVAIQLVEKGRNMRATTFIDQFKHICYCYLLRNEINKSGILDLLISVVLGQKRSRSLLESVKTRNVPACPMSAVSIQACVHMIEALTVIIGLEVQDVKYNTASSHVATAVTSLLGLQLAIKNHRDAYRRYISKNCDQHSISNNGNGGKEYFSQNDGGVFATQTPWVTADIQAISMSLDDGFARILSKYGDIIPSYSYPTSYLSELKIRLAEIEQ